MRPKIRCDGESWKILQNFLQLRPRLDSMSGGADFLGFAETLSLRSSLVCKKIYKIFHIPRHIESLNACMKH